MAMAVAFAAVTVGVEAFFAEEGGNRARTAAFICEMSATRFSFDIPEISGWTPNV